MSKSVLPTLGNLAWAPVTSVEEVEIFDRFNGVPSLGVFRTGGQSHLFWRVLGYTGDISLWLYVPLSDGDEEALEDDEGPSLLDGIVYHSPRQRYVTVGVANYYRLLFEREWSIPAEAKRGEILRSLIEDVTAALQLAIDEDLPASRREDFKKAREAVRHLVAC
ncbi:hypothetical protein GCM10011608_16770 [Micromonospora sonchi]|uniref:Uncharacterized protein n=1 Tax=Micromonospora sonchi TaxID=1763543 RepID=A0A917TSF3_9ACTN|nr:hypothetical protein [Micromonospora sonchi]GGM32941.1 hypothetical protein GCM10011608_16770 [Micromonospora sonchi]